MLRNAFETFGRPMGDYYVRVLSYKCVANNIIITEDVENERL